MKTKLLFLLAGLAVSGLVLNGCYTQMARPDREDEPSYAEESESAEVVAGESEETSAQKKADMQRDDHQRTNIYIYGNGWYGSPWYPYGYPYWYDPYPRSGFMFRSDMAIMISGIGAARRVNWYDPWCHDYYSGSGVPATDGIPLITILRIIILIMAFPAMAAFPPKSGRLAAAVPR
jgi:hypothetical protein